MVVRRANRLLAFWGLAAVAVLSLAASSATAKRPAGATSANAVGEITIGGVFCTCHTGIYVAWKKGFFAKRGVKVKDYVFTQGGSQTFSGVTGKTFDFGALTLELVVRGKTRGLPVRAMANVYPEFWALTVRSDLRGEIRTVRDLKGRKVGVSRIGSGSWAFLVGILGKNGLKKEDVEIVELGDLNNMIASLKARRVDASITWEPGTSAVVRGGVGKPIINLQVPGQTRRVLGSAVSMSQVLGAREQLLNENPQLARAVALGLRDAYSWMLHPTRKPQDVARVIKSIASGAVSSGTILQAVRSTLKVQPKGPRLTRKGYETSTKLLVETGALPRAVPFEEVVDCRFARCGP